MSSSGRTDKERRLREEQALRGVFRHQMPMSPDRSDASEEEEIEAYSRMQDAIDEQIRAGFPDTDEEAPKAQSPSEPDTTRTSSEDP